MSSTSSSESDYYPSDFNDSDYRCAFDSPYTSRAGRNTLVYYALLPEKRLQRSRNCRSSNPNFFVKAFRWYTQELKAEKAFRCQQSAPVKNVDLGNFATWLDQKYEDYLRECQCEHVDTRKLSNRMEHKPSKVKKFARMKSPWRRRQRNTSYKDSGDSQNQSKPSFEFILHPQEIPRPVSECCQKSPCCGTSEATFTLSQSVIPVKNGLKSKSLVNIRNERYVIETQIDVVNYEDNRGYNNKQRDSINMSYCPKIPIEEACNKDPTNPSLEHVSCQCSQGILQIIDSKEHTIEKRVSVICMCSVSNTNRLFSPAVINNNNPRTQINGLKEKKLTQQNVTSNTQSLERLQKKVKEKHCRTDMYCQCPSNEIKKVDAFSQHCKCSQEEVSQAGKITPGYRRASNPSSILHNPQLPTCSTRIKAGPVCVKIRNSSAQTCDTPINLEKDTVYNFPFFMKITCPDKL